MKKQICVALALFALMFTQLACPWGKATIAQAKSNTGEIAKYANAGVEITRLLYRAGKLSLPDKDAIADAWIAVSDGGIGVEKLVANLEVQYADKAVPKFEIENLFAAFDREVIDQFLKAVAKLKVPGVEGEWVTVIESFRTTIILVAKLAGKRRQTEAKLAAAGV